MDDLTAARQIGSALKLPEPVRPRFKLESILGTSLLDSHRSLESSLHLGKIEEFSYGSEEGFKIKVSAPKGLLKTGRFFPF